MLNIVAGWLQSNNSLIRQVPTPNFNARPQGEISLIVLHGISLPPNQYGGPFIDDLFTNVLDPNYHEYFAHIYKLTLSTHVLIRRDGAITQYVSFLDRAWHAGRSAYLGQIECNDFGVGIELEGSDFEPYTSEQYISLNLVIDALIRHYPLIKDSFSQDYYRIAYHSEIAPGRKTDPGPYFDESKLLVKRVPKVWAYEHHYCPQ